MTDLHWRDTDPSDWNINQCQAWLWVNKTTISREAPDTDESFLLLLRRIIKEKKAEKRLEQLRTELRAERISYEEIAELQSLAEYIDEDDVELLEAAGVPESN